jgi:hypothetical protein
MEAMDTLKPEIARLIAAKEQRRHKLAALPFAEKVRIVVQLQRMAAPVLRARGRAVQVWALANAEARREDMTPPRHHLR